MNSPTCGSLCERSFRPFQRGLLLLRMPARCGRLLFRPAQLSIAAIQQAQVVLEVPLERRKLRPGLLHMGSCCYNPVIITEI